MLKLIEYFQNDDFPTVSPVTMHRMLKKLGFKFKRQSCNGLLIEATHIMQWHLTYLHKIQVEEAE